MVFVNTNVVSRTDCSLISYFWMHWKGITGKEVEMAKETRKENQKEISKAKTGRNHEILGMLKAGVSARQISPEYNLSYSGAKKLCAKLKLSGSCGRSPGSGRKRKTTERSDRFIVKCSKAGTPTKNEMADELKAQTGDKVSSKTIQRRLKEKRLAWRKKSKKPYVSEKNRVLCLSSAREHVGRSVDQWKRVVWSDESPLCLQNQSTQYVWRTKDEKVSNRSMQGTVKHQKSIKIWGCFSWNAVGDLHRVKGIMTGEVYRKILIHHLVPSANRLCPNGFVFQHDNDPKHTSGVVSKYLKNKKFHVMQWPAQSPDLTPLKIYGLN